jgi:competence protein ComEC
MSFAATAALVGAYAAWSDWRAEHPRPPPGYRTLPRRLLRMFLAGIVGLAVTSTVAGGATAIYAAWHFQQMPSLGLFTNLVAMPIVSVIVMPFAVLGALAMPFGLDGPFFDVMGLGLTATLAVAYWFAERSPTDMVGLVPAAAVAVLTMALVVATVLSTWLRVAAMPVALVGALLLVDRPAPDLFVSEDGRLLGLDIGGGRIATNRPRPNEFTIENWTRAMQASDVVRPEGTGERAATIEAEVAIGGKRTPTLASEDWGDAGTPEKNHEAGFICADSLCVARHPSGAIVVHALDAQAAADFCTTASVIVIEDASASDVCRWKDVLVVTRRDLALHGSAAMAFSGGASALSRPRATVEYAISQPYRPWHGQRRFSREARGLAPYRPSTRQGRKETAAGLSESREPDVPDSQLANTGDAQ